MTEEFIFVLIDDDPICNLLSKAVLKNVSASSLYYSFQNPCDGFDFISNNIDFLIESGTVILLLDINMPFIDGWTLLSKLGALNKEAIKNINIFMLSSSILPIDKIRTAENPLVIDFIEKPISVEKTKRLLHQIHESI